MPRFSEFFELGLSQAQLDFVDISNEYDTRVYVDPYAIEIRDDIWSAQASEHIRSFFKQVLIRYETTILRERLDLCLTCGSPAKLS
jgi:hypothetical protein